MADNNWLKIDAHLDSCVKFRKLVKASGLKHHECLGGLVAFWSWVRTHEETGDLSTYTDDEIDLGIGLENFSAVLRDVGFIDDQGWVVDWANWGGAKIVDRIIRNKSVYFPIYSAFIDHYGLFQQSPNSAPDTQEIPTNPKKPQQEPKIPTEEKRLDKSLKSISNRRLIKYGDKFELFWLAYPETRRTNKKGAWKKWQMNDLDDVPNMMDALEQQKRSHDWIKQGGDFIPAVNKWLEEERWLLSVKSEAVECRRHEIDHQGAQRIGSVTIGKCVKCGKRVSIEG